MIPLHQETFSDNGGYEEWFDHFQLPITLLFMVRNMWVLVYSSKNKQNTFRLNLSRIGKTFCFATKPHLISSDLYQICNIHH